MGVNDMRPVFLSASLPDPQRHEKYYESCDLVAIREATRALAAVVLPRTQLVFGGHPAITPLVRRVASRLKQTKSVRVYQSDYFRNHFPVDNDAFDDLTITDSVPNDRNASLLLMRETMLGGMSDPIGVFVGGMDGVEEEHALFVKIHSKSLALPIASTGAAARIIFDQVRSEFSERDQDELMNNYAYEPMFARLLGYQ